MPMWPTRHLFTNLNSLLILKSWENWHTIWIYGSMGKIRRSDNTRTTFLQINNWLELIRDWTIQKCLTSVVCRSPHSPLVFPSAELKGLLHLSIGKFHLFLYDWHISLTFPVWPLWEGRPFLFHPYFYLLRSLQQLIITFIKHLPCARYYMKHWASLSNSLHISVKDR